MTIKGYPDRAKSKDGGSEFCTVQPIREQQHGVDVAAHVFFQVIGADAAEALSTTRTIVATAHAALVGDVISWTSGALITKEYRVSAVSTNAITIAELMSVAPTAADTFNILRQKAPTVNSSGAIGISFTNDENTGLAGATTLRVVEAGRARGIAPVTNLYSSVNVTTAAYVQIIAATAAEVTSIYIADTSGSFMILALGAALSEVDQIYLSPGFAGWIALRIAAGTRVSLKALDANATAGRFIMSGLS
jgi:hypothetical protein